VEFALVTTTSTGELTVKFVLGLVLLMVSPGAGVPPKAWTVPNARVAALGVPPRATPLVLVLKARLMELVTLAETCSVPVAMFPA
jgi:hypothetical protein